MTIGRFLFLVFCVPVLCSQVLFAEECSTPGAGKYVDLATLNSFEFNKKCRFVFKGANCAVAGVFSSNSGTEGSLKLQVTVESDFENEKSRLTCPPIGNLNCQFALENQTLKLECPLRVASSYVKVKNQNDKKELIRKMNQGSREAQTDLTLYLLESKQYATLTAHLKELSQRGVNEAAAALGYNTYYGSHGIPSDFSEAFYWNRLAADAGFIQAQMLLGTQYLYGQGTEKNEALAEENFLVAAQQDEVMSQKALAGMILMEKSDHKTVEKARKWLERARELGDVQAQEYLALLDKPEREVAHIDTTVIWSSADGEHEVKTFESWFEVRPYYLMQVMPSGTGSLPSMALGFTPGLSYENWALRAYGAVSLLNVGVGDAFAAIETSLLGRYSLGKEFVEGGMGMEFWPSPSGSALTVSLAYGRRVDYPLFGEFLVKSLSVGLAHTRFQDPTYKIFLGVSF